MAARLKIFAAFLALLWGGVAVAQSGPSFDCAKASSAIEHAICADPDLAKADRELAALYVALANRLDGSARDHLARDQNRWIGYRNGCAVDPTSCLPDRLGDRIDFLERLADGAYPFVSEHEIEQRKKIKSVTFIVDARYPQFDLPSVDFSIVNGRFAGEAEKGAADLMKSSGNIFVNSEQEWSYQQSFVLHRPSAVAISVAMSHFSFAGGAHPNTWITASLIDLRKGKAAGPEDVFQPGGGWLTEMLGLVGADLREQFKDKPGFDGALEPAKLAKLLKEPGHYLYKKDVVRLIFNAYEIGPYVMGPYLVEISYDKLKPLLRPDGPLGSLR